MFIGCKGLSIITLRVTEGMVFGIERMNDFAICTIYICKTIFTAEFTEAKCIYISCANKWGQCFLKPNSGCPPQFLAFFYFKNIPFSDVFVY